MAIAMTSSAKIPQVNKWVVAMTVMVPTFIEVMDISVVNVSLPHIQGSLNAGLDEVTWVLTSYLVSNAIQCLWSKALFALLCDTFYR